MATKKDADWIQRTLAKRCPHITVTVTRDDDNNLIVTGSSHLGSFTERSTPATWDQLGVTRAVDQAGYTVCNHCGRVYANSNRDGGPMPTVARIDISTPAWANALTRYEQRTFALQN